MQHGCEAGFIHAQTHEQVTDMAWKAHLLEALSYRVLRCCFDVRLLVYDARLVKEMSTLAYQGWIGDVVSRFYVRSQ